MHAMKFESTDKSIAVSWLNATDYVMVSATPIPNGIDYWLGYMTFIEPFQAEGWWLERSLRQMNFREDMDPFLLPDEHPAAKLRINKSATKDWILTRQISPAEKGVQLSNM